MMLKTAMAANILKWKNIQFSKTGIKQLDLFGKNKQNIKAVIEFM